MIHYVITTKSPSKHRLISRTGDIMMVSRNAKKKEMRGGKYEMTGERPKIVEEFAFESRSVQTPK